MLPRVLFRRALVVGTLVVALALPALATTPAYAGDGYWSPSGCDGGRRASEGYWWGIPGQGTYYWWNAHPGQYWVGSTWYQRYADNNWECGAFGFPTSNAYDVSTVSPLYRPGEWLSQSFEFWSMNYYHGVWIYCPNNGGACMYG